ncbi:MAG: tetratricopeptide (TPR) repeat protein [Planctomycetota bacterium]|jgi:tetratricopeptide (TPR) repeat protein
MDRHDTLRFRLLSLTVGVCLTGAVGAGQESSTGGTLLIQSGAFMGASDAGAAEPAIFDEIDALLEGGNLLPLGADWSYLPGVAEPTPESTSESILAWSKIGFDDSSWARGPSPFVFGLESAGTTIDEFASGIMSVYLRRSVDIPDPAVYERLQLELPVDDGFVFYLNGKEEYRFGAGTPATEPAFDLGASGSHTTDERPMPVVDLTPALVPGRNMLAIHAMVSPEDTATFSIAPRIRVQYRQSPENERARVKALAERFASKNGGELPYLLGREQERNGEFEAAARFFAQASVLAPEAALPLARLHRCHVAMGRSSELEENLRARIRGGQRSAALLDTWASVMLTDLGRSPVDIVRALPALNAPAHSAIYTDVAWIGMKLVQGQPARIDCGSSTSTEDAGERWGRDRFFSGASQAAAVSLGEGHLPPEGVDAHLRLATRSLDSVAPTYSIPLPRGGYQVRLRFAAEGGFQKATTTSFGVLINGAHVLRALDPTPPKYMDSTAHASIPIYLDGGVLELDFLPADKFDPWINSIEIRALGDSDLRVALEQAQARGGAGAALARVQLARFLRDQGETLESLALFEEAEVLPGFRVADRRALAALRRALLPALHSFASVDGLLEGALSEGPLSAGDSLPAELSQASAQSSPFATYMRGRSDQLAGRADEAIASFEELIIDGVRAAAPYRRMAQCLAQLGIVPEAEGILMGALEDGIPGTPGLLSTLISLRLGPLEMDPWEVIDGLREYDLPDNLVLAPTSEEAAQEWSYTAIEPPTIFWSRMNYDVSSWDQGLAPIGSGQAAAVISRSLWNTQTLFARRTVVLEDLPLLYPHLRVAVFGVMDVYLNGTRVLNFGIPVEGYRSFPLRPSAAVPSPALREPEVLVVGENGLGMYANNTQGNVAIDVGIVQPLGLLMWVADRLAGDGGLRINCGGPAFVDAAGRSWSEDRFFGWGQVKALDMRQPLPDIQGTENDLLYYSNRWFFEKVNTTWYQVPLPNGTYKVVLHFAEIEAGERVFSVYAEGKALLKDHNVLESAGYETADVHSFEVEVKDGYLDLHVNGATNSSSLSGLEILR